MIGNNKLTINQEFLRRIIQHYLDTITFSAGQSPLVDKILFTDARGFDLELHLKERKGEE